MNENTNTDDFYARQYAYDLFRRLFMEEPTEALINHLKHHQGFALFPDDGSIPALSEAITELNLYLESREFQQGQEAFENLHWDFTRLFIGPETPPAPPWESVYVSRDKLLFQQSTQDVKQFYQQHGFKLGGNDLEAADHIGYELDFLYHLSTQSVESMNDESVLVPLLQAQLTFLQQHTLAFSTPFTRNVYNHAETQFYKALSTLLHHFLQQDAQFLQCFLDSKDKQ